MQTLTGVLEFEDIGVGVWLLKVGEAVYELLDFDLDGSAAGSTVTLTGDFCEGLMTSSMRGTSIFKLTKN